MSGSWNESVVYRELGMRVLVFGSWNESVVYRELEMRVEAEMS